MEPWQKVFIDISNVASIEDLDEHLKYISCVDCHAGNNTKPNNMEEAHAGLIADPSEIDSEGKNSCNGSDCHDMTVANYGNSLHQKQWGMRKWVALRSGVDKFDQCPQSTQDGFNGECTSCHATCGDCHISIPNSAGKGLVNSHRFSKTPDQANNCTACHGSRIGHDYEGDYDVFPWRSKDVHNANGFTCLNCHDKAEMHSTVEENTDRYHYDKLPSCEDPACHSAGDELDQANVYHNTHYDDLSCFVCHSQRYNNCTGCHVDNAWQTDPEYQNNNPVEDFRIGLNPLKTEDGEGRFRFKFATLRHIPVARDSYNNWGSPDLPAYDKYPTWKYTSPHSIRKYTARTDTTNSATCWDNCHTKEGFGNPENKKYYLFKDYVQTNWPDETEANSGVYVDGQLPDGWE